MQTLQEPESERLLQEATERQGTNGGSEPLYQERGAADQLGGESWGSGETTVQSIAGKPSKPKPFEFGLPYEDWRAGQYEAVVRCQEALKRSQVVFLVADTGTGKSGIAKAVSGKFLGTTALTKTISLQEQYGTLTGTEIGRGRSHHRCWRGIDALTCMKRGTCEGMCEYRLHVERLEQQDFRIMNYAQFFALNLAREHSFSSDLVVCDEGHGLESALQSFVDLWYGMTPTWGSEYNDLLFDNGRHFLIMSASMIPALVAETMGISEDDYEVVEADNDFSPLANPVFVRPVGYITNQRPQTDRLVRWIDTHLSTATANGVIHTSSDRQTQEILNLTKYPERFIWPKGSGRAAAFERFKNAGEGAGAVLISASAHEGQDFPDNECRWQIITKVPYADLSSPHVRARRQERPDVYQLEALQRIQQACGRGARHSDDFCVNYILDANVIGLYEKRGHLLSKRFQESWRGVG